jgi:AraC-like DNA-binding protein
MRRKISPGRQQLMDALSDVLRVAQLSGGVFLHAEFTAPWCLAARLVPELCAPFLGETSHLVPYHYVVAGELQISVAGREPIALREGEMILFPGNDPHLMGSDLRLPPTSVKDILPKQPGDAPYFIHHGGGGAGTRMICGYLGCASFRGNPLFATLPAAIKISVASGGAALWFRAMFEYAAGEVDVGGAGAGTVLAKVSELLFVEAVRRYASELPQDATGWLAGLQDPIVARALGLLHKSIARDWNVDELAREVGLSRSALADRFGRVIGMPPMQYLAQWRMQVAAQSLRTTSLPLARVAERVGYESEAAFSRAFKKAFGTAPAGWRRLNA